MNNPLLTAAFGPWEILLILFVLIPTIFWVWMLIDCATKEESRIPWLLVILFAGWLGAAIYFFVRKLPRKEPTAAG